MSGAWGAQTRSSRRGFVFVEQAAEEVAPPDLQRMNHRCGRRIGSAAAIRRSQVERSVWTLLVEVADIDAEDMLELAATEDQEPVEAVGCVNSVAADLQGDPASGRTGSAHRSSVCRWQQPRLLHQVPLAIEAGTNGDRTARVPREVPPSGS